MKIAIAVRDTDLFLEATVVRKAGADVYVNILRDHVPGWKPHTSHHASGQHHQKSFDQPFLIQQKQKPDSTFKDTSCMVAFGIDSGGYKALNLRCNQNEFSYVFEIPVTLLRPDKCGTAVTDVYVDLVEPGVDPLLIPGAKVLQQERYKDAEPWIVITLLER